ncbi:MAG: FMN-binding negative transcriptional regulator [Candidatus Baltobacteraceae bacterium]
MGWGTNRIFVYYGDRTRNTMYIPRQYARHDDDAARQIIRSYPLGALLSVVNGEPFVSYLPFTIARVSPNVILTAHCARANPHWRHFAHGKVLITFRGPDGYISPRFHQDRRVNVPSWNYISVHCTGTAELASDAETAAILRGLVDQMERDAENPWSIDEMDPEVAARLTKGIVAFSVCVDEITAKFKLSQNRSDGDVEGLIRGLRESGSQTDTALADAMALFNA